MKNLSLLLIVFSVLAGLSILETRNCYAQPNVAYQWAKNIGNTNHDYGYSIAVDGSGNVLITGFFYGTADFDPGVGTANLTSAGDKDIFFAKYDANGSYVWAKSIGSTSFDEGHSIAVDDSGNVFITGFFRGTADFDPGAGTANLTSAALNDIFFAKYDVDGNYLWAKRIGSTGFDEGHSIAVDGSGNVLITGQFYGTTDFDPGVGTADLTSAGDNDIFLAKYDANGNYLWAKSIGSTSVDIGRSIAVDGSGNAFITGEFVGTADFDPGAGTANLTSAGDKDIFFAKYDVNGNYLWAKSIRGGTGIDVGHSIVMDGSGNVFITGIFSYTADFDPGPDTTNLTTAGDYDIFFAKYDVNGNYLWAKSIETIDGADDYGYSIAVDDSGNVFITGSFQGTADFDPGAGTVILTSDGFYDIFFAKYDANGNYLWANRIGTVGFDFGHSLAVDGSGNVFITGRFENTADFDPGADTANLTSAGLSDIFFAKYAPLLPDLIAPAAPQNVAVVDSGNTTVTVRWRKNSESDFLRYRIYDGTSPNPTSKIDSTSGGVGDTVKTISALVNGTRYYFRVTAVDNVQNESGYSNEVNARPGDYVPPGVPQNLVATDSSSGTITVKWRKNADPDFMRYRIYLGTAPSPTVKVDSTTGGVSDTSKTFTGLVNGTRYYLRVTALDSAGNESAYSNEVSATPADVIAPAAPQNLVVTDSSSTQITIAWAKNAEPDFLKYKIYRGTAPNPTTLVDSSAASLSDTSKTFTGLTNGTRYYLRVTAVDSAGNESAYSNEVHAAPNVATGIADILNQIPEVFSLAQNYPNPFNPSTVIRYGLPERSNVRVEVYDVLGRRVAVLVDLEQEARYYELYWNATVPTGIYFYRIHAAAVANPDRVFRQIRKMVLVK